MKFLLLLPFLVCLTFSPLASQDTFSIVAVDSITGEVGSAGASCVDLFNFTGFSTDFLGELFPGVGAINTQAYYLASNQTNARNRMNQGDTPSQIIDWLKENDATAQAQLRQYGIAALVNGTPQAAAHTGSATDDYKNHVVGSNYAIQGNILLGQQVLDSMEYNFLNAEGDLACKLMAALQGANLVGADTRCAVNGSSSLFAFLKVAQASDNFGSPSFLVSVKTPMNAGIEPIDSLQTLFDNSYSCSTLANFNPSLTKNSFAIYPNPVEDSVTIDNKIGASFQVEILDTKGSLVHQSKLIQTTNIDLSFLTNGIYFIKIYNNQGSFFSKIIKAKNRP